MLEKGSWCAPSTYQGTYNGFNDSGIATFTTDNTGHVNSLVRETIQNSLDAVLDKKKPVKVCFKLFDMPAEKFPGKNQFVRMLEECLSENRDKEGIANFFERAIQIVQKPIKVFRISDYNTCGLSGADVSGRASYDTKWGSLVKCNGTPNQNSTAGGSYGIGKSVTFLCSDLQTVFYSSLDEKKVKSTVGVARLISFQDLDNADMITTGTVYFAKSRNELNAILSLPDFESGYMREETGTDIYIMGMNDTENLRMELIHSVLYNFLVSIWNQQLVVVLDNEENDIISKDTLDKYVPMIVSQTDTKSKWKKSTDALNNYYELLTSAPESNPDVKVIPLCAEEYGKEYGFSDGDATLYLLKKKNANRHVLMTREKGMRIFEQDCLPRSIEFTGIFHITGAKMNCEFRKMETPAHDKWVETSTSCKGNERYYKKMYKELRSYIKKLIQDSFGYEIKEEIDAFGASKFLPDYPHKEGENPDHKSVFLPGIEGGELKPMKPVKPTLSKPGSGLSDDDDDDGNMPGGIGPSGGAGGPGSSGGKSKKGGRGEKSGKGGKTKQLNFSPVPLAGVRSYCKDAEQGEYVISFRTPHTAKQAKLKFHVAGEQSAFPIAVTDVKVITGKSNATIETTETTETTEKKEKKEYSYILLNDLKLGHPVKLDVKLDFDQFCLLEVIYSEAK